MEGTEGSSCKVHTARVVGDALFRPRAAPGGCGDGYSDQEHSAYVEWFLGYKMIYLRQPVTAEEIEICQKIAREAGSRHWGTDESEDESESEDGVGDEDGSGKQELAMGGEEARSGELKEREARVLLDHELAEMVPLSAVFVPLGLEDVRLKLIEAGVSLSFREDDSIYKSLAS